MSWLDKMRGTIVTKEEPVDVDINDITLYTLHKYYEAPVVYGKVRPIIGNEEARMTTALAWLIGRDSVLIRGPSGSGKSEVLKATVSLQWGDGGLNGMHPDVYMIDSSSNQGNVNADTVPRIRRATHCFIPELQNARNQLPLIKKWTERAPYVYMRTGKGGQTGDRFILPPLPILTNLAEGNEEMGDVPLEVRRRMLHVFMRTGRSTNQQVQESKAIVDALPSDERPTMPEHELAGLRAVINDAVQEGRRVVNPFVDVHNMIPKIYTESNSYLEYLLNFTKSITKFYSHKRYSNEEMIFSSIEDNYLTHVIAGNIFMSMSLGTMEVAEDILRWFPTVNFIDYGGIQTQTDIDKSKYKSVDAVKDYLDNDLGVTYDKRVIEEILNRLVEVGHLRITGKGTSYYKTREYQRDYNINWKEFYDKGIAFMEEHYPNDVEQWKVFNTCTFIHPFSGNEMTIPIETITNEIPKEGAVEAIERRHKLDELLEY